MKILSYFLIAVTAISCAPKDSADCHYSIKIKNNTEKKLFVNSAPDTLLRSWMDPRYFSQSNPVKAFAGMNNTELGTLPFIGNGAPFCIERVYKSAEIFHVFIYDSIVIGDKSWDEIRKDYLVAKRFDITLKELREQNWILTFDGH